MEISIIGVPLYYGCDRLGVEEGPDKLRQAGLVNRLEALGVRVNDRGNIPVDRVRTEDKFRDHPFLKFLQPVIDANESLAEAVFESLDRASFPLVIGGDHALGLGSISGVSKYMQRQIILRDHQHDGQLPDDKSAAASQSKLVNDDLVVIWVDAHADFNDLDSSPSGHIHGMPLAAASGIGPDYLTDIAYPGVKVRPENVHIIGARSLDPGEIVLLDQHRVNVYPMEEIRRQGLARVLDRMSDRIGAGQGKKIHLSFDLDSLDGDLVPGTGLRIPDGYNITDVKDIFERVFEIGQVLAIDFVEFNPLLDEGDQTLGDSLDLLAYLVKLIQKQGK